MPQFANDGFIKLARGYTDDKHKTGGCAHIACCGWVPCYKDCPTAGPDLTTTASGLKIEVLTPAPSGAKKPAAADRVRVNYEGRVRTDRPAAAQLAAQLALENSCTIGP